MSQFRAFVEQIQDPKHTADIYLWGPRSATVGDMRTGHYVTTQTEPKTMKKTKKPTKPGKKGKC